EDKAEYKTKAAPKLSKMTKKERQKVVEQMEHEMKVAAKALDFERAAELRDLLLELQAEG
ncbi:UvrB/UvrC motif-containing protein, partial [Bacillus vallismortis]|nr:UvrB/UvrC motif-containing protein [Bacillus vallismortis]